MDEVSSQQGRIAVITGANTGIGFETALAMAKKDMQVILACRNEEKAEQACQSIQAAYPKARLAVLHLDLSQLSSVRSAAQTFREQYEKLDVLVNNAGIMFTPYEKTVDGFESQMAANGFGHFLFTSLLLDKFPDSTASRITWLSSSAHKSGNINFADLQFEKEYSKMAAYGQSKLACLMYALELNQRLQDGGKKVLSNCAHPGGAMTDLSRHMSPWLLKLMNYTLLPFITHSASAGALPTLQASLSPSAEGGTYYGPQGFLEMKGQPGIATMAKKAQDKKVSAQLWTISEQLTGAQFLF